MTRIPTLAMVSRSWIALVVASLVLLPAPVSSSGAPGAGLVPAEWKLAARDDDPTTGYRIYTQRPTDSSYDAYRLESAIDAPPAEVAAAAMAEMADSTSTPPRSRKTVLRHDHDVVVVYTYSDLPMVSDRDVVTRAQLRFDAPSGVFRLEWHATDAEGPPPKDGVVRLEKSSGSWTFQPAGEGRSRVVYESHSDLAGSVPAWIINPLMTRAVVGNLERLRAKVLTERSAPTARPDTASR